MTRFLRDRRKAFTKAIMDDDWSYVKTYCKKYNVALPEDERVMKAGIYKAVQECIDIPEEVKNTAIEKCLKLGFLPFINYNSENINYTQENINYKESNDDPNKN